MSSDGIPISDANLTPEGYSNVLATDEGAPSETVKDGIIKFLKKDITGSSAQIADVIKFDKDGPN